MAEVFFDREVETQEVSDIIKRKFDNNQILILTGYSGVGKSGLMAKIRNQSTFNIPIISIKLSKSSVETIENFQYFNAIYKGVVDFAQKKALDRALSPTQKGLIDIGNLIKVGWSLAKAAIGIADTMPIAEPSEDSSALRKKDYLIYFFNKNNIILDIENVQNIDTQSLEYLCEIIKSTSQCTFVFEYTLTDNAPYHYKNFYKELMETNAEICGYTIEKMDFSYAKCLAPRTQNIDEAMLRDLYDKSNGNLMEIILADVNRITINQSNILSTINNLKKNEKFILFMIFLNEGTISYYELYEAVLPSADVNYTNHIMIVPAELNKILQNLQTYKLVDIHEEIITLKHDSIATEIRKQPYSPILLSGYTALKEYYNRKLQHEPGNALVIEKLMVLYIMFSDQELLSILPEIKKIILNCKYSELTIKKLEYFRKKLNDNAHFGFQQTYDLTIMLTEICLSKQMADEAWKNISLIYDENNLYHIALRAQIYSMEESLAAHSELCSLIDTLAINSRVRLISEICLLYLKTKLFKTSEAKSYAITLLNNSYYKQYPEYAFLLRNFAELCEDNSLCVSIYLTALEKFESFNMIHDMASVYISLSMIYSYQGLLEQAKSAIQTAVRLDRENISYCYVLNNLAAIDILEGSHSEITEKRLLDAILLSVSNYEKIIIRCNLMVYYTLVHDFEKAKKLAQKVETSNYQNFGYEELLHIVFQNLYFYYKTSGGDTLKRDRYFQMILDLARSQGVRESTKTLVYGINGMISCDLYYAKFPFRVDFLGYWEFTIDNDLDHY